MSPAVLAACCLFGFALLSFSQTAEPPAPVPTAFGSAMSNTPALEVKQVCGVAAYGNHKVELRRAKTGPEVFTAVSDKVGRFMFPDVTEGDYWIELSPAGVRDADGTNTAPLRVVHSKPRSDCKHPLVVGPFIGGWEAGIDVRFMTKEDRAVYGKK